MDRTLYFAKVNINDTRIYDIYKGKKSKNDIMDDIFINIQNGVGYTKNSICKLENGEENEINTSYIISSINKLEGNVKDVLVGAVIKQSGLYLKEINKTSGEIKWRLEPYGEIIRFCLYPRKERISFYTASRFGYKEFCEAFEGLLNKFMNKDKTKHNFRISLIREGIDLNSLKQQLNKIKNIELLRLEIIPPNVDDSLLKEIEKNAEKELNEMEEGNITNKSIVFQSKSEEGINTNSSLITRELDKIEKIHTKLSTEEATRKGYVLVEVTADNGRTYSTNNTTPIKYIMNGELDGDVDFADTCRKLILLVK